jgi:hypothetical protein
MDRITVNYYYTDSNNQPNGPVSLEELRAMVVSGKLGASTMIAPTGSQNWIPIGQLIPSAGPASNGRSEPLAIWSFVLSLVGLLCCGFFVCVPAVICGHLALSKIGKDPHLGGKGLALAGLIIGYVGGVFWLLYMVFFGGIAVLQALLEGAR